MNKRYAHKSAYEPGRMKHLISFYALVSTDDGSGGQDVSQEGVRSTRAIKERIKDSSQLVINAGASELNQDCYFVFRNMCGFYPTKDMMVREGETQYTIRAVIPVDDPVNYVKILCVKEV